MTDSDVLIVGAGPCGIASALALKDTGVRSLVLDQAPVVAAAWRGRYDRLRLNTARPLSHLPGRPFPKGTPMFPSRDEMIEHVQRHAMEDGLQLRLNTRVDTIAREDGGWAAHTQHGVLAAPEVIVATGYLNVPVMPAWAVGGEFGGRLLHAAEYKRPDPFEGDRVLVVGPGCSGMQIAAELAGHGKPGAPRA